MHVHVVVNRVTWPSKAWLNNKDYTSGIPEQVTIARSCFATLRSSGISNIGVIKPGINFAQRENEIEITRSRTQRLVGKRKFGKTRGGIRPIDLSRCISLYHADARLRQ